MKIYIDSDFRCHVTRTENLMAIETDAFDGKCSRYVEGYRYIPAGESWAREDGQIFAGEMIAPAEDIRILDAAQGAYEEALAASAARSADMEAALGVLGVQP